jgi:hypothetical protein
MSLSRLNISKPVCSRRGGAFDLAQIACAFSTAENAISPDLSMLFGRKPKSRSEFLEDYRNTFSD